MPTLKLNRRSFVTALTAAPFVMAQDTPWQDLFDGGTLTGWRPSEHKSSWKVIGGSLVADGPRSHLFYEGPVNQAMFRNFELEVEVLAHPECNSGVYFHTAYQESGFPEKGFEVQINNTATGEGSYRERKKTASLYGIRNVYKQFVPDDQWFKLNIAVRGKRVQIFLDRMLMVDYTEPTPPVIPAGGERGRFLDRGTFALQCHNDGSRALFRRVRVRPLFDDLPAGPALVVDQTYQDIINIGRHNVPMVDYHVHLKGGLTLDAALTQSHRDGIFYGIAANAGLLFPIKDDASAIAFADSLRGSPVFVALQAEGREWTKMLSKHAIGRFDYVFTDSMTWTDNRGKRLRLWIPEEVGPIADPQEFMDTLVARTVGLLEQEPIDIYVNPTFLPAALAPRYDEYWTEERMRRVAGAAAKSQVAIEINNRYSLPGAAFIRLAKEQGCKFTFGSNNEGPADLRRCEYGIRMLQECKLQWQDFFVPGAWWPKAVNRKGSALGG